MDEARTIFLKSISIITLIFASTHSSAVMAKQSKVITDVVDAYTQLAKSFTKDKKYSQAIINYQHALELSPHNAFLHWKCANAFKEINRLEEAINHYQEAVELEPDNINMRFSLANTLVLADFPEKAFEHYELILDQYPQMHPVLYNYGFALKKVGYITQAIDTYNKVLAIEPSYEPAHFSMALAYLMIGDFAHGWPEYEWREKPKKRLLLDDSKAWNGTQDLTNATIALIAEQGLGDTFQFIRYAQLLKENGAKHIICQVQPALMNILSYCSYIDTLIPQTTDIHTLDFDYHIQLLSLPYRCHTTLETIPSNVPYLQADPELINYWKDALSSDHNFKIGICWQGNAHYATQNLQRAVAAKSITPSHFEPLSKIKGITLYSLQKINGLESLKDLSFTIHEFDDFDKTYGRFMDTAAIMHNLDLILTVDTSIAHLAGALGVPVWVMLPFPADWRWLLNRDDTPWYPTMRLFRQDTSGDWDHVFDQVVIALQEIVKAQQ